MLGVSSYPELFSSLIGFQQYNNIWDVVVKTGLAYIPFILMICENTIQPYLSQESKSAHITSLKRVEISLVTMIFIIMVACQPCITLRPNVIHFKPLCSKNVDATPGHSGTTYDDSFSDLKSVKVPLWWYAVISLSHGFTASTITGIGCVPKLREERTKLNLTRIESAPLRLEVQQFVKSCWVPSWRKYNRDNPDISAYTKKYGASDTEWIGSHAFLEMTGYYDALRAPVPIQGFPYQSQRDWVQGKQHGKWGSPSCKSWWSQPSVGLYDKLRSQIKPDLWQKLTSEYSNESTSDQIIKTLISHSTNAGYVDGTQGLDSNVTGMGNGVFAGLGMAWHSISYFPKMYVLVESLPLIQSYLLMACYIFLAVAIPITGYKPKSVLVLSFIIFSIIFWSYLWQLAVYVDSAMIKALDPLGAATSNGGTPILTEMVSVMMYIILPLFWSFIMGWAGVQAGNGMTSFIDRAGSISAGGGLGAGMASRMMSRLGR